MALPYPILFRKSFDELAEELQKAGRSQKMKVCIVTDTHVAGMYLEDVRRALKRCCTDPEVFIFEAGEESKNLDTVRDLYRFLIESHIQRSDLLLALGGGVTGDLTGFTAATYLRGIRFVQVPTTLLSQVDSSVGGKTGVDLDSYKNMVGAFHQPVLVYMNMTVLKTLPEEQYASGMGEVIKTALIRDRELFGWIEEHTEQLLDREPSALGHVVRRCCEIKAAVVEEDPYDRGVRAVLNFGHTIGHAVEKEKNFTLLHGQCVSIGMAAACRLSRKRGLLAEEEECRIRKVLTDFDLPLSTEGLRAETVAKACLSDKKREQGKLRFILLNGIGDTCTEPSMSQEELLEGIREIMRA